MISVFVIHSHITFLSAVSIIDKLSIKNYVVIIAEGYKIPLEGILKKKIYLPEEFNFLLQAPTYGNRKIFKIYRLIKKLDRFVENISNGQRFNLYIPHSKNFFYQVLLTNINVVELNYIDEGLLSYTSDFHKDKISTKQNFVSTFIRFPYQKRSNVLNSRKKEYSKIFRFVDVEDENPKLIGLNWPTFNIISGLEISQQKIFIFDNPVNGGVCSKNEYSSYISKILTDFSGEKLYIKMHPRENNIAELIQLLDFKGINYKIIDDSEIVELILLNSKSVSVYGGWSSILFYASSMGHEVTSFLELIKLSSDSAKRWIEQCVPDTFYNANINFRRI